MGIRLKISSPMNNPLSLHIQAVKLGMADLLKGVTPYVGYHHNMNLGDVELYNIAKKYYQINYLAPNIVKRGRYFGLSKMRSPSFYLVGGGTLIFADNILRHCEWLDRHNMKPVFLGTGVLDKLPIGLKLDRWRKILTHARYLGVRGSISSNILNEIDIDSEILGDLGFMVNLHQERSGISNGELVVIPRSIRPSFYQYFEKDMSTRHLLKELVMAALQSGIKVKVLCVSRDDASVLRGWIKTLPSVDYLEYDGDFSKFEKVVSNCGCLVSMRMHPGIFASAWGVPTILLDQRHKFFDSFSVLDSQIADISDPEKLTAQSLLNQVRQKLTEDELTRNNRFNMVKIQAKKQKLFFDQLSSSKY